jgi:hypothetical protein
MRRFDALCHSLGCVIEHCNLKVFEVRS